jgi:hypothetical protein
MTQRERQASGRAFTAPPNESGGIDRLPPSSPSSCFPIWEAVFRNASPAERAHWLDLAERQGVLYTQQFPNLPNGTPSSDEASPLLLNRLLAGQTEGLEALRVPPASAGSLPLDTAQCEAIATALHTPDICLIQGLPGTGKSQVVAEIVTRAVRQGERVLLLAPACSIIDRILGMVAGADMICALRCVAPEEQLEALPPPIRSLTYAERSRLFTEHALNSARQEVQRAKERLACRHAEEGLWPRLEEMAARHEHLTGQLDDLSRCREQVPTLVHQEIQAAENGELSQAGFALPLRASLGDRDQAVDRLQKELDLVLRQLQENRREHDSFARRLDSLQPLIKAKQKRRWWTGSWWRATLLGDVVSRGRELQDRLDQAHKAVTDLEALVQRARAEQEQVQVRYQTERMRRSQAEVARRQGEYDDQEAALRQELRLLQEKWQETCAQLDAETPRPLELNSTAIAASREKWHDQFRTAEERLAFARQWADCLHNSASTLPEKYLGFVNLVAATVASLPTDVHFGDSAAHRVPFDLLVLEEAHEVTEAEFLSAARRARRWVLVGEPQPDSERRGHGDAQTKKREDKGTKPVSLPPRLRASAISALRPGFFERMWRHLHFDPRRLPYRWVCEDGRLCCCLRPLTDTEREVLHRECVADRPDIELRIATPAGGVPFLAEVVFPPSMSIYDAKAYIFHELGELPVNPCGQNLCWVEESDRLYVRLADSPAVDPVPVALGNGVREMVGTLPVGVEVTEPGSLAWYTFSLEFDRREGWAWEKVDAWVQEHLGVRNLGRTVRLTTLHRMDPSLAQFLSDLLFHGTFQKGIHVLSTGAMSGLPHVLFIPVPVLHGPRHSGDKRGNRKDGGSTSLRNRSFLSRPGAGLETDLADLRQSDRLPGELRSQLPRCGIVNYMEAEAIVRLLEVLASSASSEAPAEPVGVVALYQAQAALVRHLINRSPRLAAAGHTIKVDVPAALRSLEWATVLVSLTRSHSHRAVSYGDGPHLLSLAMTRARKRLVLFGDPGTLVRRAQWVGPVDHLDEATAAREHDIIARLVLYLQGQGLYPNTFHLHEGGGLP